MINTGAPILDAAQSLLPLGGLVVLGLDWSIRPPNLAKLSEGQLGVQLRMQLVKPYAFLCGINRAIVAKRPWSGHRAQFEGQSPEHSHGLGYG